MKRLKHLVMAFFALAVLFSFAMAYEPYAATETISLGQDKNAEITEANTMVCYKFVPQETAEYIFTSTVNSGDTYGYVYDKNLNIIKSDDDGGGNANFSVKAKLTAGTTYYLGARWYDSSATGTIPVSLIKSNHFKAGVVFSEYYVDSGEKATLQAYATADDMSGITYTWYNSNNKKVGSNASYTTAKITEDTSYYVIIKDSIEKKSYTYYVNVSIDSYFVLESNSENYLTVKKGSSPVLKPEIRVNDRSKLVYTWYCDGNKVGESESYKVSKIQNSTAYSCNIYDGYGKGVWVYYYVRIENHLSVDTINS